jgi:hypothetical protein
MIVSKQGGSQQNEADKRKKETVGLSRTTKLQITVIAIK